MTGLANQLIHGDVASNVLLHDGMAPAVIDLPPYRRPVAYSDAVFVVDALLWWHTEPSLIQRAQPSGIDKDAWTSLLTRAFIFRLHAFEERSRRPSVTVDTELDGYADVAQLIVAR